MAATRSIEDGLLPEELRVSIKGFWPPEEWDNAASISWLESRWSAFVVNDTTAPGTPCGAWLGARDGTDVFAERSVGYFQINSCNFPTWEWQRLYNAYHNAGTAHMLWDNAGRSWAPWFFSARELGLV